MASPMFVLQAGDERRALLYAQLSFHRTRRYTRNKGPGQCRGFSLEVAFSTKLGILRLAVPRSGARSSSPEKFLQLGLVMIPNNFGVASADWNR